MTRSYELNEVLKSIVSQDYTTKKALSKPTKLINFNLYTST